MPKIIVRRAAPAERQALEALQRRASLEQPLYRQQLLDNPDAISLPAAHIDEGSTLVAMDKGAVAGFAVVLPRDDGEAELDGLFVEPDRWRLGLGRRLVEAAASVARGRGADWLYVIANPQALPFYDNCGFTKVGEAQTRFALAPVMRRSLAES